MFDILVYVFVGIVGLLLLDFVKCISVYIDINFIRPVHNVGRSIMPHSISLKHSVLFMAQKMNYYWHFLKSIAYLTHLRYNKMLGKTTPTQDDVIHALLNTSFVIFMTEKREEDKSIFSIKHEGFKSLLHSKGGGGRRKTIHDKLFPFLNTAESEQANVKEVGQLNSLHISFEISQDTKSGKNHKKMLTFKFNQFQIVDPPEQLAIIMIIVASVLHPIIHSYFNLVYSKRKDSSAEKWDDLFLHGQSLDHDAHFYPSFTLDIHPDVLKHHLTQNSKVHPPLHNALGLRNLVKHSRYVNFLLRSRVIVQKMCVKYKVPIHPEYLFLSTVMHSIEHYSLWKCVEGFFLETDQIRYEKKPFCNLFAALFVRPSQYFWTNLLKAKQTKNDMYKELYQELADIDTDFADQVTLSITY